MTRGRRRKRRVRGMSGSLPLDTQNPLLLHQSSLMVRLQDTTAQGLFGLSSSKLFGLQTTRDSGGNENPVSEKIERQTQTHTGCGDGACNSKGKMDSPAALALSQAAEDIPVHWMQGRNEWIELVID